MRIIYFLTLALLTFSCTSPKMLQNSLNKFKAPIGYLHDSKIDSGYKTDTITLQFTSRSLDSLTHVSKISALFLPFIVFNYAENKLKVKLGQSSILQYYDDFFFNSIIEESNRSGRFIISDRQPNDSTYSLEIIVDTCQTYSKYQSSATILFMFFAYSYSFIESGFPAETRIQVSAKFKKGNSLVFEKIYMVNRTQPFLYNRNMGIDKLRADFTANMVESLSLSTKQCIEDIINDTNNSLQNRNTDEQVSHKL